MDYFVTIIDLETYEVIKEFGPYSESKADRIEDALLLKTDLENFDVTIETK